MGLSISVLGTFHAVLDERPVTGFRSGSERALLTYLALEVHQPHSRESLAALLWPDVPEDQARNNLRVSLHRLRSSLTSEGASADWFHTGSEGVYLDPDRIWIDAQDFEDHASTLLDIPHLQADSRSALKQAAELYRGEFLEGFHLAEGTPFDEWVEVQREHFHRLAMQAFFQLTRACIRRGELGVALGYANRQLELEPWREEAHRQKMRILALRGERTAALSQFALCQRVLEEELGIGPSVQTLHLYEQIEGLYASPQSSLPSPAAPFLGRSEELAQLADLLADPAVRQITLTGPGGTGKSRLALEAASRVRLSFLHGAHWIDLTSLHHADQIPPAIASTLGFSPPPKSDLNQALIVYLRDKEILLVLDNFEHLLEGTSTLLKLIDAASEAKLMVTSRERLRSRRETVVEVGGLSQSPTGELLPDSLQMFAQSARRVNPRFEVTKENHSALDQLADVVEGMPLALELAASWSDAMTPAEIVEAVTSGIAFLTATQADFPDRHRSIQAVFRSMWERLSPAEQHIVTRLSVFVGPFDHRAAEGVSGASIADLHTLVSKSLIHPVDDQSGHMRFTFHPLLKAFAQEQMTDSEREKADEVHRNYVIDFLVDQSQYPVDGFSPKTSTAIQAIRRFYPDVQLALRRTLEQQKASSLRPCFFLFVAYYEIIGDFRAGQEFFTAIRESMEASNAREIDIACAQAYEGWYRMRLGQYEKADALLEQGISVALRVKTDGDEILLHGPNARGLMALARGHIDSAEGHIRQSLETSFRLESQWSIASYTHNLGQVALARGDLAEAEALYQRGLSLHREVGDSWGMGQGLRSLSNIAVQRKDYARAASLLRQSLEQSRSISHRWGIAKSLYQLGELAAIQSNYEEARTYLREALALVREIGEPSVWASTQADLGTVHSLLNEQAVARYHLGRAIDLSVQRTYATPLVQVLLTLARLRADRGDPEQAHEIMRLLIGQSIEIPFVGQRIEVSLARVMFDELADELGVETEPDREPAPISELAEVARRLLDADVGR